MYQLLNKMKLLFFFYCLFSNDSFISTAYASNCDLPDGCRLEKGVLKEYYEMNENGNRYNELMIMCDINNNEFSFKFDEISMENFTVENCLIDLNDVRPYYYIYFSWKSSKELTILDRQFNFTNVIRYSSYIRYYTFVHLLSLKGFDLNFLGEQMTGNYISLLSAISLSNCRLDFYHEKKKINSCEDILKSNITSIMSIFQVRSTQIKIENNDFNIDIILRNVEFKESICPLVFNNSAINHLVFIDLVDTFYKRNVLSFTNETLGFLESDIKQLQLHKVQHINVDLKLLNPWVFNRTNYIYIVSGSLNSIDGAIFRNLYNLFYLNINPIIFRKINHKQGIEWIKQINYGANLNLSNKTKLSSISSSIFKTTAKKIVLESTDRNSRKKMSIILPDEDFCIYVDFPFNQFVIVYEYIKQEINFTYKENELTCTYLWLAQYYKFYYKYFILISKYFNIKNENNLFYYIRVLNTTDFKSISKCNFEDRINLCNKSNYKIKDIWDESDIFILSKKMQTAFKIMLYPTAFLGLITNIIVVIVILKKENNDLFKGIKQYSYLYLNSIFCIIIMVIELLSWMTECFYPFEVFCPEIRKFVPIQFFKIVFKECLITMLRFMCNFTYVAFALNRISLIGKDHGKLVTFFSELGIKVFIGVTIFISSSLSWIKGFKYQVNYLFPFLNYPMSTEMDITIIHSNAFNDAYFITNFICDLFNNVLFVVICVIIDICMVVQLRRVLGEKTKKSELMNPKQNDTKKAENENIVNKAIKMVVLNSAIGIFFKLPASFIPLLNVVAEFYYKDRMNIYNHPGFGEFYSTLQDTELISIIQDISYFLYTLSLFIQIFIYNGFDKKFQTGFERLKNRFKKSNNAESIID